MKFVKLFCSSLLVSTTTIVTSPEAANAGGFYLQELLDSYQGAASAGAQALGTDPSTVFHNPAAMSRLKGRHLTIGGGVLLSDVEFSAASTTPIPGNNGGEQTSATPLLGMYYSNQLSGRLTFGAGLFSVSGTAIDPFDSWAGRFQLQEIELLSLTAVASLAYKIDNAWSIGASAGVTYGDLDFRLATPSPLGGEGSVRLQGDDIRPMAILGVHYEPNERVRLGVTAFSGFDMEFGGSLQVANPPLSFATDTSFDFAPAIRAGLAYKASLSGTFLASVSWEKWSTLDSLFVSTSRGTVAVPRNWDDTYHAAIGYRHQVNPDLMLQAGLAYDSSPVSAIDRTADAPIDRQIRVSVGAEYRLKENLVLGGAVTYADYGDAAISSSTLIGEYESNDLLFLTFGLRFNFPKN